MAVIDFIIAGICRTINYYKNNKLQLINQFPLNVLE